MRVNPWVFNNKVALIGDATNAMFPFYGQGLNCSLEDGRVLGQLIEKYKGNWCEIFPVYQSLCKVNADTISKPAK